MQGHTLPNGQAGTTGLLTLNREGAVREPAAGSPPLAGLRTQGHESVDSALRGDFPAVASVVVATLVPQYRCASVPDSHRIPDYPVIKMIRV